MLPMTPEQMILLTVIGFVAGCMSGMFGIGGGAVRIPLLNLAGIPLLNAFAINLLVIPLAQSIGAWMHRKNIDLRMAFYVVIGGAIGSMIGALFTGIITVRALAVVFVLISFLTVFGIYLDRLAPRISAAMVPAPHNLVLGALLLNLLTGIRGGSGGSLFPPFLRAMHLDIRRAIATSIFVTIFTASAGLMVYAKRGDILWMHGLFVLAGSVVGTGVGSRLSLKTRPFWLEAGLSVLVVCLSFITVYKAF
jgi:uncharacterized membrane protein YfcA